MFREKSIRFQGSRERLGRMVSRYEGEFLGNQEFTLLWQASHYKKLHRLTFRFRCRYEKENGGYRITYRIRLALSSRVRILLRLGFWLWAITYLWDPAEPAAAIGAVGITVVMILTDHWQLRDCEKEFLRRFTAVTK